MTVHHECPQCGEKLVRSLGDLQRDPVVTCGCGATIEVKGDDSPASSLDGLDDALRSLGAKRVR